MSIVETACSEILSEMARWKYLNPDEQYQCFQNAYRLFGREFIQALTYVQKNSKEIKFKEASFFIEILFINKVSSITGFECTCETSWRRKSQKNCSLVCKHQLVYLLKKLCFGFNNSQEGFQQISINQEVGKLLMQPY